MKIRGISTTPARYMDAWSNLGAPEVISQHNSRGLLEPASCKRSSDCSCSYMKAQVDHLWNRASNLEDALRPIYRSLGVPDADLYYIFVER